MLLVPPLKVAYVSILLVLQRSSLEIPTLARASRCDWWNGYHQKVSALFKTGSRGGEPENLAATKFYLLEAESLKAR